MPGSAAKYASTLLIAIAGIWLFAASAWISDDALISLRQVMMTAAGEGIVWNAGQRVQAFTHPLWFLLITAGTLVFGAVYHVTLGLSALGVAGALWLYGRMIWPLKSTLLFAALLALPLTSAAFRDYMTSGLENPLSLFLTALIAARLLRAEAGAADPILWLALAATLLTRPDHAFHFGPLALYLMAQRPAAQIYAARFAVAALILWAGFATFYFGAALPNTYYAKLGAEIAEADTRFLSLAYMVLSLEMRPGTLLVILAGVLSAPLLPRPFQMLALGILAHLAYLISIGGDFMIGRFLVTDFMMACILIGLAARRLKPGRGSAIALMLVMVSAYLERPHQMENDFRDIPFRTLVDERRLFYDTYGLFSPHRSWPEPAASAGASVHVMAACGFIGGARITWPSEIRIIDMCGLTDPLMARLPVFEGQRRKAGHFKRAVPLDYAVAAMGGAGAAPGTALGALIRDIDLATKAPLLAPGRFAAIWRLNTGAYALDRAAFRRPAGPQMIAKEGWVFARPTGYPRLPLPSKAHVDHFVARFGSH